MRAMANVNAELVKSGRGTNLLVRGYSFRKDRRYPAKQHWRCTVPGCPGRAHTDFTDPPTVLRETDHNHIPDEEAILRKRTKHVLCVAAKNRPLVPLSQVSAWYIILSMHPCICVQPACVGALIRYVLKLYCVNRPANRPAFGPVFYQMSRVPLSHGNVPLFVRSRIFLRAQFVTLPRAPTLMQITQLNVITVNGNSVRFLAKINCIVSMTE